MLRLRTSSRTGRLRLAALGALVLAALLTCIQTGSTGVQAAAAIQVVKTASAPTIAVGQTETFTITLTNTGNQPFDQTQITDTIPSNFTNVVPVTGSSNFICTQTGNMLDCNRPLPLAPGQSISLSITATATTPGANIVNGAIGRGFLIGLVAAQSTGTASVTIVAPGSIAVSKSASQPTIPAGPSQQETFTISVQNTSASQSFDVIEIIDTVPSNFVNVIPDTSTGFVCSQSSNLLDCARTGSNVVPGQTITLAINATPNTPGTGIINTANAKAFVNGTVLAQGQASATVTITGGSGGAPGLPTKSCNPPSPTVGTFTDCTLTLTSAVGQGGVIGDSVGSPNGATAACGSPTSSGFNCTQPNPTTVNFTCAQVSGCPSGSQLTVRVSSANAGAVSETVSVPPPGGGQAQAFSIPSGNNLAPATFVVVPAIGAPTKSCARDNGQSINAVPVGTTITCTITLTTALASGDTLSDMTTGPGSGSTLPSLACGSPTTTLPCRSTSPTSVSFQCLALAGNSCPAGTAVRVQVTASVPGPLGESILISPIGSPGESSFPIPSGSNSAPATFVAAVVNTVPAPTFAAPQVACQPSDPRDAGGIPVGNRATCTITLTSTLPQGVQLFIVFGAVAGPGSHDFVGLPAVSCGVQSLRTGSVTCTDSRPTGAGIVLTCTFPAGCPPAQVVNIDLVAPSLSQQNAILLVGGEYDLPNGDKRTLTPIEPGLSFVDLSQSPPLIVRLLQQLGSQNPAANPPTPTNPPPTNRPSNNPAPAPQVNPNQPQIDSLRTELSSLQTTRAADHLSYDKALARISDLGQQWLAFDLASQQQYDANTGIITTALSDITKDVADTFSGELAAFAIGLAGGSILDTIGYSDDAPGITRDYTDPARLLQLQTQLNAFSNLITPLNGSVDQATIDRVNVALQLINSAATDALQLKGYVQLANQTLVELQNQYTATQNAQSARDMELDNRIASAMQQLSALGG